MSTSATITRGTPVQPGSNNPLNVIGSQVVTVTLVFSSGGGDAAKTIASVGRKNKFGAQGPVSSDMVDVLTNAVIAGGGASTTLQFREVYSYGDSSAPVVLDANSDRTMVYNASYGSYPTLTNVIDLWIALSDGTVLVPTRASNGTVIVEVSPTVSPAVVANQ